MSLLLTPQILTGACLFLLGVFLLVAGVVI